MHPGLRVPQRPGQPDLAHHRHDTERAVVGRGGGGQHEAGRPGGVEAPQGEGGDEGGG